MSPRNAGSARTENLFSLLNPGSTTTKVRGYSSLATTINAVLYDKSTMPVCRDEGYRRHDQALSKWFRLKSRISRTQWKEDVCITAWYFSYR